MPECSCVSRYMCAYACVTYMRVEHACVWRPKDNWNVVPQERHPPCFLRQGVSSARHLSINLVWPASEPQGSSLLHFHSDGITSHIFVPVFFFFLSVWTRQTLLDQEDVPRRVSTKRHDFYSDSHGDSVFPPHWLGSDLWPRSHIWLASLKRIGNWKQRLKRKGGLCSRLSNSWNTAGGLRVNKAFTGWGRIKKSI